MLAFADRTGLTSRAAPRRYLWTDAFAVCNFLGLARATKETRWDALALALVEQVHDVLGRRRDGGWLSGLPEAEGARHPTSAGLRIGKPLPERAANDPFDERREWQRDGQYFHYLTRWMHALLAMSRHTGDARYGVWARELAIAAHRGFVRRDGVELRMIWKASTDLSRALIHATGQHDPLDGLITCLDISATTGDADELAPAIHDFTEMLGRPRQWVTADLLGLGGLLLDAHRVARLRALPRLADGRLLLALLRAALVGLRVLDDGLLDEPGPYRLAFRELGLAIGLRAAQVIVPHGEEERALLDEVATKLELAWDIVHYWDDPRRLRSEAAREHQDIDEVMLATALAPEGWLG